MYIELFRPIRAEGPFGIGKSVTGLALAVDEETEFRLALEGLLEIDSGNDARPGSAE